MLLMLASYVPQLRQDDATILHCTKMAKRMITQIRLDDSPRAETLVFDTKDLGEVPTWSPYNGDGKLR